MSSDRDALIGLLSGFIGGDLGRPTAVMMHDVYRHAYNMSLSETSGDLEGAIRAAFRKGAKAYAEAATEQCWMALTRQEGPTRALSRIRESFMSRCRHRLVTHYATRPWYLYHRPEAKPIDLEALATEAFDAVVERDVRRTLRRTTGPIRRLPTEVMWMIKEDVSAIPDCAF